MASKTTTLLRDYPDVVSVPEKLPLTRVPELPHGPRIRRVNLVVATDANDVVVFLLTMTSSMKLLPSLENFWNGTHKIVLFSRSIIIGVRIDQIWRSA
jgi:hypothetical protein